MVETKQDHTEDLNVPGPSLKIKKAKKGEKNTKKGEEKTTASEIGLEESAPTKEADNASQNTVMDIALISKESLLKVS